MNSLHKTKNTNASATYIIVGLGNIGKEYAQTRHNSGFMVVDDLARKYRVNWRHSRFEAEIAVTKIDGKTVILAKPTTLMNLSGRAVSKLVNYYKVPLENLLIIYDDVDIKLGKIRVRRDGSAGTHNGMRSIVQALNSQAFPRIRVGIGPKPEHGDMVALVLGKFSPAEQEILYDSIETAVLAIECYIAEGIDTAMNKFN